jgi:hypothetical protein
VSQLYSDELFLLNDVLLGAQFASMMKNINQDVDSNAHDYTMINDTSSIDASSIDTSSISNNQNQTRMSFPNVSCSSMLDNAM